MRKTIGLGFLLAFAACSSTKSTTEVPGNVHFTMNVDVAAGAELFRCQFVTMPAGMSYVVAAAHHYTPGSHHMLLFRTDLSTIPAGGDQIQDCYEGQGGTIMSHVRGVVYGSQVPDGSFEMPSGVAFQMASQEVLLFQVHYLNATPNDIMAKVDVGLSTITDGSSVPTKAGNLFYYDPFIDVPPQATTAKAGARCTLTSDITLVNIFPHYHSRGYGYEAYMDPPGAAPSAQPFYTSTDWEHPAAYTGQPIQIKAGTAIRWNCDYQNPGTNEYFQGPSAADNEMCMFTGLYYPAVDQNFEYCMQTMDSFGTGSATCSATTTCLQQCPAGSMPTFGAGMANVPDCYQKCFVASCPSASTPLLNQFACIQQHCDAECNQGMGNCPNCVLANCGTEYQACQSHTCP